MMIPSNYQINVAKNDIHYCKIELSEVYEEEAIRKRNELKKIFGEDYELDLIHVICYGEPID